MSKRNLTHELGLEGQVTPRQDTQRPNDDEVIRTLEEVSRALNTISHYLTQLQFRYERE